MGEPYGIRIIVLASEDFDPEEPTGATLHVTKPDDDETQVEWTGIVTSQSSTSATARYTFNADGDDLDVVGTWRVWVQWTVAGQAPGPRSEVVTFNVIAADQR